MRMVSRGRGGGGGRGVEETSSFRFLKENTEGLKVEGGPKEGRKKEGRTDGESDP